MLVSTTSVSTMLVSRDGQVSVSRGARCEEVSCEVSVCEQRASCQLVVVPAGCSLNGVLPTRHVDRNKAMISSSGRVFLWYRLWLMMVPVD